MKRTHAAMSVAVIVLLSLLIFDGEASADLAEPVERVASAPSAAPATTRSVRPGVATGKTESATSIGVLRSRAALSSGAADQQKKPDGGLFLAHSWMPPPPPPEKPAPPPPPMAPPLPFTYLGKKIEEGKWEVYLARGNETFIVQEQSIIDQNYRVDAIRPPAISLTYLPLNQSQALSIGVME
jgi:hypothetical protein